MDGEYGGAAQDKSYSTGTSTGEQCAVVEVALPTRCAPEGDVQEPKGTATQGATRQALNDAIIVMTCIITPSGEALGESLEAPQHSSHLALTQHCLFDPTIT